MPDNIRFDCVAVPVDFETDLIEARIGWDDEGFYIFTAGWLVPNWQDVLRPTDLWRLQGSGTESTITLDSTSLLAAAKETRNLLSQRRLLPTAFSYFVKEASWPEGDKWLSVDMPDLDDPRSVQIRGHLPLYSLQPEVAKARDYLSRLLAASQLCESAEFSGDNVITVRLTSAAAEEERLVEVFQELIRLHHPPS